MSLKARLQQYAASHPLYGLFCSTPATLTVELIAAAGYDFVVIDLEHTLIGPDRLASMLLAARAAGIAALVRWLRRIRPRRRWTPVPKVSCFHAFAQNKPLGTRCGFVISHRTANVA